VVEKFSPSASIRADQRESQLNGHRAEGPARREQRARWGLSSPRVAAALRPLGAWVELAGGAASVSSPRPAADPVGAVESGVPDSTAYELLVRAASQPTRVLTTEGTEEREFSAQRLRCKILRNDVEDGALALIFAVAALSFHDARPRGASDVDYIERDD